MARESFDLDPACIAGRGLKTPTGNASPDGSDGWTINVYDENSPHFWLEVRLSAKDLARMTAGANSEDR